MRFLPFVLKHLRRNWLRTASTVFAISICIFLFCTLQTVLAAVTWSLQSADASRLVTRHAVSLVFNVPLAYRARIEAVPGVRSVARVSWFGGFLPVKREDHSKPEDDSGSPDFSNFFPNLAVDAGEWLAMYPEYLVPEDQQQAWLKNRRGCLIGRTLADSMGWKVGDGFFLESFIPPYRKPDGPFEFVVSGIMDTDLVRFPGTDLRLMVFHFEYLYEGTGQRVGAGQYTLSIEDPSQAATISRTIDALFENSDAQTRTETEAAFRAGFVAMAGNLALLLNAIGMAVTFTILLVTANTMSMAVRERRTEIAVLKTLGFPSLLVMGLILGESLLIGAAGGAVGVTLGSGGLKALTQAPMLGDVLRQYPSLGLSPMIAVAAFAMSLAIGGLAGLVPALLAYRARITDTLRQV